ncbi:zinc finger protein 595-like isoform X2 [Cydia pomonella]|uniref:zinc finger protein 595-like isoform X2 n=1 Tax=Cydia pomonella TaxID=82600 RepID=UPI002ADE2AF0|nr:zinc finger protein 595-like isoform X2 [Cydia pomonella]
MMNMCRTCLGTPANKLISDLGKGLKWSNKNCFEIIAFCLDVEVTKDSKITTNLCSKCYRKIITLYKFKALSLKNDSYLKSLYPVVQLNGQKLSVYVDENGIKHENFLEPDEFGPSLVEDCNEELKIEIDVKTADSQENLEVDVKNEDTLEAIEPDESNDEPLHVVQKDKYDNIKNTKGKVKKKRSRPGRVKSQKKHNSNHELQVCEECGKSVRNLKDHTLQHLPRDQRPRVQCKACPKTFATLSGRYNHYKYAHLGLKPKCDICNKEVRCLNVHKMQVHNPNALPYSCVSCERRFVTQSALDVHMVAHTMDPKFECNICQKKFRMKHLVLKHMTHSEKRLYNCNDCGLALKTKDTLRNHLLLHRSNKDYPCELCSKSFQKLDYLRVHMVTHTKEKRYECRYCSARFGRAHHRSRHEATAHQKQLKDK